MGAVAGLRPFLLPRPGRRWAWAALPGAASAPAP